jgi:hypothetical protein
VAFATLFFHLVAPTSIRAATVEMKAGTAKTIITPDGPVRMAGGGIGGMSGGKTNDITVRVLTLNDGTTRLVIVTYDLNSLDMATPLQ